MPTIMYSMQNKWEPCRCSFVCSVDSFYLWLFCKLPALEEFASGCAAVRLMQVKIPSRFSVSADNNVWRFFFLFLTHCFYSAYWSGRLTWHEVILTRWLWWVNKSPCFYLRDPTYAAYCKTYPDRRKIKKNVQFSCDFGSVTAQRGCA